MKNFRLNIFFLLFPLFFLVLNGMLVFFNYYFQEQQYEREISFFEQTVVSHINGIKDFFQKYDTGKIKPENLSTGLNDYLRSSQTSFGPSILIYEVRKNSTRTVASSGYENVINLDSLRKVVEPKPIQAQVSEDLSGRNSQITVDLLLKTEEESGYFLHYQTKIPEKNIDPLAVNKLLVVQLFILIVAIFMAGFIKLLFSGFLGRIISLGYKISNSDFSVRFEPSLISEFDKAGTNLNLMLSKLEDFNLRIAESEQSRDGITKIASVINRLADGDFTVRTETEEGVLGYLSDSLNVLSNEMGSMILDIKTLVEQVSDFTADYANNVQVISENIINQNDRAEKTYHAAQEMSLQLEKSFKNIQLAQNTISLAARVAGKGTKILNKMNEQVLHLRTSVHDGARKVASLTEHSRKIQEILEVIEELTARTNLLALNASIEASRGAKSNKGFALIADEIRGLAEKSKSAARDIQQLLNSVRSNSDDATQTIEQSTEKVKETALLVKDALESFREIESLVNQTSSMIDEIVKGNEIQAQKGKEFSETMAFISNLAQQSVKSIGENAKLSEKMKLLSSNLAKSVSRFKLN